MLVFAFSSPTMRFAGLQVGSWGEPESETQDVGVDLVSSAMG